MSNLSVEGTLPRGKRDRYLESVQTLSGRRNLHVYLEQKAEMAVQGECGNAQLRKDHLNLRQKWTSRKPIENSNARDWSFIRRISMDRSGSKRKDQFLWRIGNEKQTLPKGIDEMSMQQERDPTIVSQLLNQIQDLQNQVNSLSDAREFLRSRNNEQLWSIPRSQSTLDHSESQRYALPRLLLAA